MIDQRIDFFENSKTVLFFIAQLIKINRCFKRIILQIVEKMVFILQK